MSDEDSKLLLDIKGTFDVAIARNKLRRLASEHHLPLLLQARAAAVVTSIAELVLFQSESENRQLQLEVFIHNEPDRYGIEFQFFAALSEEIMKNTPSASWQLNNISDELELSQQGSLDHVIMRLWARREES